jgi:hypothetical protein
MPSDAELIRQAAQRIRSLDPEIAREARSRQVVDSFEGVATEAVSGLLAEEGLEVDGGQDLLVQETIVSRVGRPVFTVKNDDYILEIKENESEVWRSRLTDSRSHEFLRQCIPAVGRVAVENHPKGIPFVGTGWLVADEVIVTNRHVALEFAQRGGSGFAFLAGPDPANPLKPKIDFLQEFDNRATREFRLIKVLHIEADPGPDMALVQVEHPRVTNGLANPIKLATGAATPGQFIAAIGYPARDIRIPDQALVIKLFGDTIYDKKRMAPGQVQAPGDAYLTHDCSTLGGNSGSALIDIKTGEAIGLHFAGLFLRENRAVPASTVAALLKRVGRPVRPSSEPKPSPAPVETKTPPVAHRQRPGPAKPAMEQESTTATWTIPLEVSISLGTPVLSTAGPATMSASARISSPTRTDSKSAVDAALQQARASFSRLPGVLAVRTGYRFQDGWPTNDRVLVVVVAGAKEATEGISRFPAAVAGVPVEVRPVTPLDLLEASRLAVEGVELERVPEIHYVPPDDVRLEEVNEDMKMTCHVSPDEGWIQLKAFLGKTRKSLTVGMYDFTAPHIEEVIKSALGPAPRRFNLAIQIGASVGSGTKQDDLPEQDVIDAFEAALKKRFRQAYVPVSGPGRLFASAYHIKVAVRDSQSIWLSSGNWQSSNQPEIEDGQDPKFYLTRYNREWHAIIENENLAIQFEKFLLHDLEQAEEAEATESLVSEVLVDVPIEAIEIAEETISGPGKFFPALPVSRKVRVQPLLTPDNFQEKVLDFVRSATKSLLFQNQSLSLLEEGKNEERFDALVNTLVDKQKRGLDVRVIIRGEFDPSLAIERLKERGFDTDSGIRVQDHCHTKGIVIDSNRVLLGSHNWTNQGVLVNRDASLILYDAEAAKYFEDIFEYDWKNLARKNVRVGHGSPRIADPDSETPKGFARVSLSDLL